MITEEQAKIIEWYDLLDEEIVNLEYRLTLLELGIIE